MDKWYVELTGLPFEEKIETASCRDIMHCLREDDFKKCIDSHWHTLLLACVP